MIEQLAPGANLVGADLRKVYGSGFDLSGADLRGADLRGASFSEGFLEGGEIHTKYHLDDQLYGSDFSNTNLRGADLRGANLSGCDFSGADLSGAILDGADLTRAWLHSAILRGTSLIDVSLSGANLENALLEGARLDRADFESFRDSPAEPHMAKYVGVRDIPAANVKNACFRGANLRDAKTDGVNFSQSSDVQL